MHFQEIVWEGVDGIAAAEEAVADLCDYGMNLRV